jgi:uncharacterized repeat protein (TIGR02543 family)
MQNNGTGAIYAVKTVTPPADSIGAGEFPENPDRANYLFEGWNTLADGLGDGFAASTVVSGDITVYAQWTAPPEGSYTVTFRLDDGTGTVWAVKTVIPPGDTTVDSLPAPPVKTGYNFGGWYTEEDGNGSEFNESTAVTESIPVYAKWDTYSYTVTFDNDGGDTAANPTTKTVTSPATTVGTLPVPPTKTGYNFGGWYTEQDGDGSEFNESTAVTESIKVFAKWDTYSYTVTFNSEGADTAANPAAKTVASPATTVGTLPAPPDKTDHNFVGWNTEPNGTGTGFTATTTVTGNITVHAQWEYTYTVTFDNDGGNTEANPTTKTVTSPATTVGTLPVPPTKTGYNFGGWYTEKNGGGSEFTAGTPVTGSIKVFAKWDTYSYTVTFDNDGGDTEASPAAKTVASPNTTIDSLPVPPTKTGYNFGGWYTEKNGGGSEFTAGTPVTGSIKVFAKWDTYSYTVTFNNNGGNTEADPMTKTVASPATTIDALPNQPTKLDDDFVNWNTEANGSGTVFTAATTVTGDITVYAKWSGVLITLNLDDAGDGAFSQGSFTVSKTGNGDPSGQAISINGSGYTNPRWMVDGTLKGTDTSIIIQAADYNLGGHNLSLLITKNGVTWSKDIAFTVTN